MINAYSCYFCTTNVLASVRKILALLSYFSPQFKRSKSSIHIALLCGFLTSFSVISMESVDAVRLLQQATFGPTPAAVEKLKAMDAEAWIEQQLGLPVTLHRPLVAGTDFKRANHQRVHAWFKVALHGEDQLRQRMAYALSQIFVVSQVGNRMRKKQAGLMNYYDTLVAGALGNYRDLMYNVTMHPVMGNYLTYSPNRKAAPNGLAEADENFARELLQLMSLGPYLLQQNGEYQITDGQRIPTYSQEQVKGFAKVFTGLCYEDRCDERFAKMDKPMTATYADHDLTAKKLLSRTLAANPISVKADIDGALDDIFAHANMAPFISERLIQLLVTSNPTPEYVGRVAAVFTDNGNGVKGDLGAVAKAILLDDEARNGHSSELIQSFGKLREPILMLTHYFRALNVYEEGDAPYYYNLEKAIGQAPLMATSVFNFYQFDYAPPNLPEGLVAPEFQINTEVQLITYQNFFFKILRFGGPNYHILVELINNAATREEGIEAYANYIDLMFTQGKMSAALREQVISIINMTRAKDTRANGVRLHRFHDEDGIGNMMVMLFLSPEFAIQR